MGKVQSSKQTTKEGTARRGRNKERFIFKTAIDGLLAGLISIGCFLGRPPNEKPGISYLLIGCLLCSIMMVLVIYSIRYRETQTLLGLTIVIGISVLEVILIGLAFQETSQSILITILIVSPSVIIFDKLLG